MDKQTRTLTIENIKVKEKTIDVAFASSKPYIRQWRTEGNQFADEILEISHKALRSERLNSGANLIINHDTNDVVGVVVGINIDEQEQIARAKIRFGESARAQEILKDVEQGIRRNISVGYLVHDYRKMESEKAAYLVNDWEPVEISLVTVPADISVGVGRSQEAKTTINNKQQESIKMTDNIKKETEQVEEKETEVTETSKIAKFVEDKPALRDIAIKSIAARESFTEFQSKAINQVCNENFTVKAAARKSEATNNKPLNVGNYIGLTTKEAQSFSLFKLIKAMAEPNSPTAQSRAAFEMDVVSTATAQKRSKGLPMRGTHSIPDDVLMAVRAVSSTTTAPWISTNILYGSFIDMLKNALLFPGMGATVLDGLTGNVAIPKQSSGVQAYAIQKDGTPAESSIVTTSVNLEPHTIGATIQLNRSALIQDSIGLENLVRQDIVSQMALHIQDKVIQGSGRAPEPRGITRNPNIEKLAGATNGKALSWADVVMLQTLVASKNAMGNSMSYLTNAMVRGKLMTTEKANNTAQFIWTDGQTPLNGFPAYITNAVPSNLTKGTERKASAIIFGNWSDLVIGLWTGVDLTVDPYTQSQSGAVVVSAFQDYDIAIKHEESFAYASDVLTV